MRLSRREVRHSVRTGPRPAPKRVLPVGALRLHQQRLDLLDGQVAVEQDAAQQRHPLGGVGDAVLARDPQDDDATAPPSRPCSAGAAGRPALPRNRGAAATPARHLRRPARPTSGPARPAGGPAGGRGGSRRGRPAGRRGGGRRRSTASLMGGAMAGSCPARPRITPRPPASVPVVIMTAAVVALALLAALAVFQGLLVAGLPLGRFAWGGQHEVLPAEPPDRQRRVDRAVRGLRRPDPAGGRA